MANAVHNLIQSVTETPDEEMSTHGFTAYRIEIGGDRNIGRLIGAVVELYPRAEIDFDALVGEKVTFARYGENMLGAPMLQAVEATIFRGRSEQIAYKEKGKVKNGYVLNPDRVLDVVPGYGGVETLKARIAAVRAGIPVTEKLTQDALNALPDPDKMEARSTFCPMALFGRWRLPDAETACAVWLVDGYVAEDDIVEGTLLVPEAFGCSEHGSAYGRDLLANFGVIKGFPGMSLKDALDLSDLPFADALAAVVDASEKAPTG